MRIKTLRKEKIKKKIFLLLINIFWLLVVFQILCKDDYDWGKNSQSVSLTQYMVLSVRLSVCLPVPVSFINVGRRRQSSYDVARLYLTEPTNFWRNSTPFFGAAAFCMTKIGDFRRQLQNKNENDSKNEDDLKNKTNKKVKTITER